MRVPWPMVFCLVLGAGRGAWAQGTASPCPRASAVAAFPDVVSGSKPHTEKDPMAELLDADPYAEVLAAIHLRKSLDGSDVDDESPYEEQLRFVNPYTDELRSRKRAVTAPNPTELLDIDTNPYSPH